MTEGEFLVLAGRTLDTIQAKADEWFEVLDIDVDAHREGEVLTLVFQRNGQVTQVVINAQTPLQELWLAEPLGAYHYRYEQGRWVNTRENAPDLLSTLQASCQRITGQAVEL